MIKQNKDSYGRLRDLSKSLPTKVLITGGYTVVSEKQVPPEVKTEGQFNVWMEEQVRRLTKKPEFSWKDYSCVDDEDICW